MFRRAWWRAIPSELLVPVAMAAALDVASALLPFEYGTSLSLPTRLARDIVVLCGLLELRRRTTGSTSRVFLVGALVLGANAAVSLSTAFAGIVLDRRTAVDWLGMSSRSEEHTSELQSRGLISYAVF